MNRFNLADRNRKVNFYRAYKSGILDENKITDEGWQTIKLFEDEYKDFLSRERKENIIDTSLDLEPINTNVKETSLKNKLVSLFDKSNETNPLKNTNSYNDMDYTSTLDETKENKLGLFEKGKNLFDSIINNTKPISNDDLKLSKKDGNLDPLKDFKLDLKPMNNDDFKFLKKDDFINKDPLIMALKNENPLDTDFINKKKEELGFNFSDNAMSGDFISSKDLNLTKGQKAKNTLKQIDEGIKSFGYGLAKPFSQPIERFINDAENKHMTKEQLERKKIENEIWNEERLFKSFIGKGNKEEITKGEKALKGIGSFTGNIGKLILLDGLLGTPTSSTLANKGILGSISGMESAYSKGEDTKDILKEAIISGGSFMAGAKASEVVGDKLASELIGVYEKYPEWGKHLTALVKTAKGFSHGSVGTGARIGLSNALKKENDLKLKDAIQSGLVMGAFEGIISYVPWEKFIKDPNEMKDYNVKLEEINEDNLIKQGYVKLSSIIDDEKYLLKHGIDPRQVNPFANDIYINQKTKDIVVASTREGGFLVPKSMIGEKFDEASFKLNQKLGTNVGPRTQKVKLGKFSDGENYSINRESLDGFQKAWVKDITEKGYKETKPGLWVLEKNGNIIDVVPEFTSGKGGMAVPLFNIETEGKIENNGVLKGILNSEYDTSKMGTKKTNPYIGETLKEFRSNIEKELKTEYKNDKQLNKFMENVKDIEEIKESLDKIISVDGSKDIIMAEKNLNNFISSEKIESLFSKIKEVIRLDPTLAIRSMKEFNDEVDYFLGNKEREEIEPEIKEIKQTPIKDLEDIKVDTDINAKEDNKKTAEVEIGTTDPIKYEVGETINHNGIDYEIAKVYSDDKLFLINKNDLKDRFIIETKELKLGTANPIKETNEIEEGNIINHDGNEFKVEQIFHDEKVLLVNTDNKDDKLIINPDELKTKEVVNRPIEEVKVDTDIKDKEVKETKATESIMTISPNGFNIDNEKIGTNIETEKGKATKINDMSWSVKVKDINLPLTASTKEEAEYLLNNDGNPMPLNENELKAIKGDPKELTDNELEILFIKTRNIHDSELAEYKSNIGLERVKRKEESINVNNLEELEEYITNTTIEKFNNSLNNYEGELPSKEVIESNLRRLMTLIPTYKKDPEFKKLFNKFKNNNPTSSIVDKIYNKILSIDKNNTTEEESSVSTFLYDEELFPKKEKEKQKDDIDITNISISYTQKDKFYSQQAILKNGLITVNSKLGRKTVGSYTISPSEIIKAKSSSGNPSYGLMNFIKGKFNETFPNGYPEDKNIEIIPQSHLIIDDQIIAINNIMDKLDIEIKKQKEVIKSENDTLSAESEKETTDSEDIIFNNREEIKEILSKDISDKEKKNLIANLKNYKTSIGRTISTDDELNIKVGELWDNLDVSTSWTDRNADVSKGFQVETNRSIDYVLKVNGEVEGYKVQYFPKGETDELDELAFDEVYEDLMSLLGSDGDMEDEAEILVPSETKFEIKEINDGREDLGYIEVILEEVKELKQGSKTDLEESNTTTNTNSQSEGKAPKFEGDSLVETTPYTIDNLIEDVSKEILKDKAFLGSVEKDNQNALIFTEKAIPKIITNLVTNIISKGEKPSFDFTKHIKDKDFINEVFNLSKKKYLDNKVIESSKDKEGQNENSNVQVLDQGTKTDTRETVSRGNRGENEHSLPGNARKDTDNRIEHDQGGSSELPIQQSGSVSKGRGTSTNEDIQEGREDKGSIREEHVDTARVEREPVGNERHTDRDTETSTRERGKINNNFTIKSSDDLFSKGSKKERYKANIKALKTLETVLEENRVATDEEKEVLSKFSGFGAIQEVFDNRDRNYSNEYRELKSLADKLENLIPKSNGSYRSIYEDMRATVLNAHYTSFDVINEMYRALDLLGFKKGNLLEPSMGSGNFFGMLPEKLKSRTKLFGVELDSVTGNIAKLLYPDSNIRISGYENVEYPNNYFDVAIGNVPFGNFGINDKTYSDKLTSKIHNYFFSKSIDKIKPGGILMFLTSTGTMDSKEGKFTREYLSNKANLLLAVRLPNTTFKDNAGTEVTTDLIILQKLKEGELPGNRDWVNLEKVEFEEDTVLMNSYYVKNKENILGKITLDKQFKNRTIVEDKDNNYLEKLKDIINNKIPRNVFSTETKIFAEDDEIINQFKDELFGSVSVKNNKIYRKQKDGKVVEITENKEKIKSLYEIKNLIKEVMSMQRDYDTDEKDLELKRKKLKSEYDKYIKKHGNLLTRKVRGGKLSGRSSCEEDFGYYEEEIFKNKKGIKSKKKIFFYEPETYLLKSLEIEKIETDNEGNEKQVILPSAILTERTHKPIKKIEKVNNATEGLIASLNTFGYFDIEYVSKLSGKNEEEILQELGDKIYKNPIGEYETKDEYLSGDVRLKLQQAKEFAKLDKRYERNIKALESVLPEHKKFENIVVRTGDSWLPYEINEKIILKLLGLHRSESIKLTYSPVDNKWNLSKGNSSFRVTPEMDKLSAGTTKSALDVVKTAINNTSPEIKYKDIDGKTYVDIDATDVMRIKIQEVRNYAKEYLFNNPDEMLEVENVFNEKMNNIKIRDYEELAKLFEFPHIMNKTLRPHQKTAVVRALLSGNTLLAHGVGAGKTYELICIAVESKRLGLCNKPLLVVPNTKLTDFESDAKELYPGINILALDDTDFDGNNIKRTLALAGTNNWDLVIVRESSFKKIPVSPETQIPFVKEELKILEDAFLNMKDEKQYTVKKIEDKIKQLQLKLENLSNNDHAYKGMVYFEDLGFDHLLVDEAHKFKNYPLGGKSASIKGLHIGDSEQAVDMMIKSRYISRLNGGKRGIVFATGTPITNSMAETYILFKYLRPDLLDDVGITSFDSWVDSFAEIKDELEIKPDSSIGYTTRFGRFVNQVELITKFRTFTDVQFTEDLGLPLPEGEFIEIKCEPHPFLSKVMDNVKNSWQEASKDGKVLKYYNIMKTAPLDIRLVLPDPEVHEGEIKVHEGSKINKVVNKVVEVYKDSEKEKGTQLIFLFKGNSERTGFNMWSEIKKELISKGIPEKEVEFVTGDTPDSKLEEIYRKVNKGLIRVVIGSYSKLGVGVNVQERLKAIHELDVPDRPVDLEQAEGRIIRQGNTYYDRNEKVQIYRYVTIGEDEAFSGDAFSWQMVEKKLRDIKSIMKGEIIEEIDGDTDDEVSKMALLKASAMGDERWFKQAKTKDELAMLEGKYNSFKSNKGRAKLRIDGLNEDLDNMVKLDKDLKSAIKKIESEKENNSIKVDVNHYSLSSKEEIKLANEKLKEYIKENYRKNTNKDFLIGQYKGIHLKYKFSDIEGLITMRKFEELFIANSRYYNEFESFYNSGYIDDLTKEPLFTKDNFNIIERLNKHIERLPDMVNKNLKEIEKSKEDIEKYKEQINEEFKEKEELEYKKALLFSLDKALDTRFTFTKDEYLDKLIKDIFDSVSYFNPTNKEEQKLVVDVVNEINSIITNISEQSFSEKAIEKHTERIKEINKMSLDKFSYNPDKEIKKKSKQIKDEDLEKETTETRKSIDNSIIDPNKINKKDGKIKSITEIKEEIEEKFGISISQKRFRPLQKGVAGTYNLHDQGIKVKTEQNLSVIAHELGHHLDDKYNITGKHEKLLRGLSPHFLLSDKYSKNEIPFETFAEFVRLYMTTENEAFRISEELYEIFINTLDDEDLKNINSIREDIFKFYSSTERERLKTHSRSRTEKPKKSRKELMQELEIFLFDDKLMLKEFSETVEKLTGEKLNITDDPYKMSMLSMNSDVIVRTILTDTMVDPNGEVIGESYSSLMKDIKKSEMKDFDTYLKIKHAVTLFDYDKQVFSEEYTKDMLIRNMKDYEKDFPHFKKLSNDLYNWWDNFYRSWVVDTGLLSEEVYTEIRSKYPTYVPNFRVIDPDYNRHIKRSYGNQKAPINKMKGDDRDTYEVLESFVIYIDKIVKTQKRNEVGLAIHNSYKKTKGLGHLITKVPKEIAVSRFDARGLKEELINGLIGESFKNLNPVEKKFVDDLIESGRIDKVVDFLDEKGLLPIDLIEKTIDDVITYFTTMNHSTDSEIFTVIDEKNNTHFYQVHDKLLLDAIINSSNGEVDGVVRLLGMVKRFVTNLTTGSNIFYSVLSNIWGDVPEGYVYGSYKNPMEFTKELFKSMAEVAKKNDGVMDYYRMGGGNASPIGVNRKLLEESLKEIFPDKGKNVLSKVVDGTLTFIERVNDNIETVPRYTEYKKALKIYGDTYEGKLKAMYDSMEVTVNFKRGGKVNKTLIGYGVPYLSSGLQGFYKLKNETTGTGPGAKKRKLGLLVKSLMAVTLFQIIELLRYQNDEDYNKLPNHIKDNYWILFKKEDRTFVRVRMPRELGVIFGAGFRRAFESFVKEDPLAFEGYSKNLLNTILPPNPIKENIFSPFIEVAKNKDWKDSPIVPDSLLSLPPEEQFNATTSEISKGISRAIKTVSGKGISPKNIDYLINQYTGIIGDIIIPLTTKDYGVIEHYKRKAITDPTYSNKDVNNFYETKEILDKANTLYNRKGIKNDDFDPLLRKRYSNVSKEMSDIYERINMINDDTTIPKKKKEELNRVLRNELNKLTEPKNLVPTELEEFEILLSKSNDVYNRYKDEFKRTRVKPKLTQEEESLLKASKTLRGVNTQLNKIDNRIKNIIENTTPITLDERTLKGIEKLEESKKMLINKYLKDIKRQLRVDIRDLY